MKRTSSIAYNAHTTTPDKVETLIRLPRTKVQYGYWIGSLLVSCELIKLKALPRIKSAGDMKNQNTFHILNDQWFVILVPSIVDMSFLKFLNPKKIKHYLFVKQSRIKNTLP